MQKNNTKNLWNYPPVLYPLSALLICLALWFIPYTNTICATIDHKFFIVLNKTLAWSIYWQKICGWLNHPNETWLNLIVMLGINIFVIISLKGKKRTQAMIFTIYCWLLFQLGLCISHFIFKDLLAIERESPSLLISPIIKLSELVQHPVKEYSENSFPAGHTFVLIYWAGFTAKYATKKLKFLTYLIAIVLIFPRLISGAHWLSDIIFTIAISYIWLTIVINTPLYYYVANIINLNKYLEN